MNGKLYTLFVLAFLSAFSLTAQITITDADLVENGTHNWTNDNIYILDGPVFLEAGGTLNIEAGTVIKAKPNQGDVASALIITRGAQIFAEGTASQPIIFTAEDDDLSDSGDFTSEDRGEWGGLLILGRATVARPGGTDNIEGLTVVDRTAFGCGDTPDDEDNSGVLRHVSIRHGGAALAPGDEINGLTLGGVGSGTTIEFVEVFANLDDGIEFFGGTVDVKYASVAFCGDDSFDYDFGYRGRGQFWFSLQGPEDPTGRAGEHDGANPDNQAPFSQPTIYNATYIGTGDELAPDGDANDFAILVRDNGGGFYNNSIFTGFPAIGLAIEDRDTESSFERLLAGDLAFNNNTWFDFGAGNTAADLFTAVDPDEIAVATSSTVASTLSAANNTFNDPAIASISRTPNGGLDPRLTAGSPDLSGNDPSGDAFFQQVSYRGAFGNGFLWLEGWTALDEYGYLGDEVTPVPQFDCTVIKDSDLVEDGVYNWTADQCYILDGLVFLEEGGVLNIEAGTVIRGLEANLITTGDNTAALIITRDAQIFANGTAAEPVIFSAAADDLSDDGDFTIEDRGEWGGLLILGNATIARPGGVDNIEGITVQPRTTFGGGDTPDDADNSGRLNYVSIRHGGAALAPGDEINGLTLGGVGSGTEMDYIEVIANLDDGIEWFGGTVDVKHAAVAACGDDAYDYDFGYRGRGQFWFSYQEPESGTGRAGEHDGANPDNQAPFSQPTIFNATYVGLGADVVDLPEGDADDFAILMRDNAGGFYNNSVFIDFPGIGVALEDRNTESSFERMEAGDLAFNNNFWFGFGAGSTAADLFVAVDPDEITVPGSSATVASNFTTNGNSIEDPQLINMDRSGAIDPRPVVGGPAATGAIITPDDFFESASYFGAFEPGAEGSMSWLTGWTAIDEYGIVDNTTSVNTQYANGFLLDAPVPNPANNQTIVSFELPSVATVNLDVIDVLGRPVAQVIYNERLSEGQQQAFINTRALPQGTYVIRLQVQGNQLLQKLVVTH